jgi:uncharacterized protein YndB with AHSA1/START domain
MASHHEDLRVVSVSRDISAEAPHIFELIADPTQQPRWDGNDNLLEAPPGQRVTAVGDVFTMTTTTGNLRENHVVEFDEGHRIAWRPSEPGQAPPGHLWRWELEPIDSSRTRVTHTYDWTQLTDEGRWGDLSCWRAWMHVCSGTSRSIRRSHSSCTRAGEPRNPRWPGSRDNHGPQELHPGCDRDGCTLSAQPPH